jgi:hypothetical protein
LAIIGAPNASVLPVPVSAFAITSLPFEHGTDREPLDRRRRRDAHALDRALDLVAQRPMRKLSMSGGVRVG